MGEEETPEASFVEGGIGVKEVAPDEKNDLIEKETGKKAITEYISEERKGDRQWDIHDSSKFMIDYPNWKYKYSLSDVISDLCKDK